MNPVAFEVGNFEIRWYGILIACGVLVAMALTSYNCKRRDIDFDVILDGFLITFPVAIIGARAYYVIFEFNNYRDNLIDIFNIRQGGLAIHGGLIGAFIAVYIFTRIKKLNMMKYLDVVAPSIILAQAIGRWGN